MNTRVFSTFLVIGSMLLVVPFAHAILSKVILTARSINLPNKKPAKPEKDKDGVAEMDERKLEATLRNTSPEAISGLTVNFFYLGHAAAASEIKVLQKDTKKTDVPASGELKVESKVLAASFTPAYTTKPKKDSKERPERIKASGEKFSGWAVQLISGTELVAEAYSTPAMKAALGAEGFAPAKP